MRFCTSCLPQSLNPSIDSSGNQTTALQILLYFTADHGDLCRCTARQSRGILADRERIIDILKNNIRTRIHGINRFCNFLNIAYCLLHNRRHSIAQILGKIQSCIAVQAVQYRLHTVVVGNIDVFILQNRLVNVIGTDRNQNDIRLCNARLYNVICLNQIQQGIGGSAFLCIILHVFRSQIGSDQFTICLLALLQSNSG